VAGDNGPGNPIVSVETATFVPFDREIEAHFFAALMNSSPARCVIECYSSKSTGSFGSPHVLQSTAIPKFNPQVAVHLELAELSKKAHSAVAKGSDAGLEMIDAEIDDLAAGLWNISKSELKGIQEVFSQTGEK